MTKPVTYCSSSTWENPAKSVKATQTLAHIQIMWLYQSANMEVLEVLWSAWKQLCRGWKRAVDKLKESLPLPVRLFLIANVQSGSRSYFHSGQTSSHSPQICTLCPQPQFNMHAKIITYTDSQRSDGLLGQTGSTLGRAHKQACGLSIGADVNTPSHECKTSEHIMSFI